MNTIKDSIKTIIISLMVLSLVGVAYAWTPPTAAPTGGNTDAPINTSGISQIKTGTLQVNGFRNIGATVLTGNVGIGTTSGSIGNVQITTGGVPPISNRLTYGTDGTGWKFAIGKNQRGTITEQLTIQDNGNVGIGTTAPQAKLQIAGRLRAEGNVMVGNSSSLCGIVNAGDIRFASSKFWGCDGASWIDLGGSTSAAPPPPACSNECSPSGTRSCSGSLARTCGNYDTDSCLEWSTGTSCTYGCSAGVCSAPPRSTSCTYGSRTYSPGSVCYTSCTSEFVSGFYSVNYQTCQGSGTWSSGSATLRSCTYSRC